MNNEQKDSLPQMDWQQVVLNGGPPCFYVEGPQYCGRAQRWPGHGNEAFHDYVSLDDLLTTARQVEREGVKLTPAEIRVLTDYHYYEAEKAITRRGCKVQQRAHLERLATLRALEAATRDEKENSDADIS